METKVKDAGKKRVDIRLTKEQKEYFEYAAQLGGFRTLTEYILHSANEKARNIVRERESFLASQRDREIFFDALLNPPVPNAELQEAAVRYKNSLHEK